MKVNIILVLTPFHVSQLKRLENEIIGSEDRNVIFYGNTVSQEIIDLSHSFEVYEVPKIEFNLAEVLKDPYRIIEYRKRINELKSFFDKVLSFDNAETRLILFSYHGVVPQVLAQQMKAYKPEIIEIEEGLAHYYDYRIKDHLLSVLYRIVTPFLIGMKLKYRGDTGRNSDSDILYIRFPEFLKKKLKKIEYRQIPRNTSKSSLSTESQGKVLIFTSPFSEYKQLSLAKEETIIKSIIEGIHSVDIGVVVKMHPKESSNKYMHLSEHVTYLPSNILGESVNYFQYKKIIHFGSSIILDILDSGYPSNNLITVEGASFSKNLHHIFRSTHLLKYDRNFIKNFENAIN